MIRLTILGPPITKKNSQRIIRLGNGRPSIAPSKSFVRYQKSAGVYIPGTLRNRLSGRCNVKGVYFMPTRRKVDLNNLLEATCDILVHYGVLEDDNSNIVFSHDGSRVRYDKEQPRAEIEILPVACETCRWYEKETGFCYSEAPPDIPRNLGHWCPAWEGKEV